MRPQHHQVGTCLAGPQGSQWKWGQKADKNLKVALFNYSPPVGAMLKEGSFLLLCHGVGARLEEPLSSFRW